jgi:segregation and condensation protein A
MTAVRALAPRPGGAVSAGLPELEFDLDVFHGPFDLLVTLILREEIDLWEVSVSRLIAEYVVRLADSGDFDLEATSQFIVLVASLLEMKSRLLLTDDLFADEEGVGDEEVGEELLVALVRYTQFKRAGEALADRWAEHAGRIYRQAPVPARFLHMARDGVRIDPQLLVGALAPLLREPPAPDVSHITDLAVTLVAELRRLRRRLADGGAFTFATVAPRDRLRKALTFFALLELHSCGEVRLVQSRPFADITVTPLDGQGPQSRLRGVRRSAADDDGTASSAAALAPAG